MFNIILVVNQFYLYIHLTLFTKKCRKKTLFTKSVAKSRVKLRYYVRITFRPTFCHTFL